MINDYKMLFVEKIQVLEFHHSGPQSYVHNYRAGACSDRTNNLGSSKTRMVCKHSCFEEIRGISRMMAARRSASSLNKPTSQNSLASEISRSMPPGSRSLLRDVRELILGARSRVAQSVDASLTILYWQVGSRIRNAILGEKRATYGEKVVMAIAARLETEFGRGFGEKNLRRMIQFAETFPDEQIVAALLRQLGWTHFTLLLPIKDSLRREFYAEMCRVERWNTRTLQKKIQSMLFERTALSRRPKQLAEIEIKALRERDQLTPDLFFRDPYLLDFLGLKDTYAEKDLEMAILREMESFILELGAGFAFLERQKRMIVDGADYYLDLLFFHRDLRRLVAVELKIGEFQPGDKGQMELYLRWLDRHERKDDEAAPIGLILCAGKRQETIELLDLDSSGIKVSSYWTEVLPKAALESKLHEATRLARHRLRQNSARAGETRREIDGRARENPS
jgi:predicted nuclease of restriction endonuclease-like (RecB) superfamily